MRKKRLSERERRRIQTTKERHGADFFKRSTRKAGRAASTHFNSDTGRAAAYRKHELARIRRAEQQQQLREEDLE